MGRRTARPVVGRTGRRSPTAPASHRSAAARQRQRSPTSGITPPVRRPCPGRLAVAVGHRSDQVDPTAATPPGARPLLAGAAVRQGAQDGPGVAAALILLTSWHLSRAPVPGFWHGLKRRCAGQIVSGHPVSWTPFCLSSVVSQPSLLVTPVHSAGAVLLLVAVGANFLAPVPGRCQEPGTGVIFPGTGHRQRRDRRARGRPGTSQHRTGPLQ